MVVPFYTSVMIPNGVKLLQHLSVAPITRYNQHHAHNKRKHHETHHKHLHQLPRTPHLAHRNPTHRNNRIRHRRKHHHPHPRPTIPQHLTQPTRNTPLHQKQPRPIHLHTRKRNKSRHRTRIHSHRRAQKHLNQPLSCTDTTHHV